MHTYTFEVVLRAKLNVGAEHVREARGRLADLFQSRLTVDGPDGTYRGDCDIYAPTGRKLLPVLASIDGVYLNELPEVAAMREALEAAEYWLTEEAEANPRMTPPVDMLRTIRAALGETEEPKPEQTNREILLAAALARIIEFEAEQTKVIDDDENCGKSARPPTGDDWNELSALIRSYRGLVEEGSANG